MVSYKCRVAKSRQLHLRSSTYVLRGSESCSDAAFQTLYKMAIKFKEIIKPRVVMIIFLL